MRILLLGLLLAGCSAPGSPPRTAAPSPVTLVITPTPAALAPGLVHFPGYAESLKMRDPGSATADSIARGYSLFQQKCAPCHAADLSGEASQNGLRLRDLRELSSYKFGLTDQALYRTIQFGIPGTAMGRSGLSDPQVFDLVHFLRSRHKP